MAEYSTLIPQNAAVKGARRIGIYNKKGNRVGFIPLGNLAVPKGEKLYSFGALSDVHYQYETGADDFRNALTYLNNTEDVAFTCICGDLTRNGTDAELNEYKTAVSAHSPDTPVYAIAGNHDTYQGLHDSIQTYTGQPLYYSFEHGDDVFIMVGIVGEAESDLFRTEILQWLYETLEANRNKRCFLFQHIPTYEGSGDCLKVYGGTKLKNAVTSTVFKSLLSHYPNVIHFHGHTHMRYRLQEYGDNANYDNYYGCHSVHIPALAVQRDSDGNGFVSYIQGSEGYVVDVYENGIHLRGRDFVSGEFLPIASYWLDTTLQTVEAGTYTDSTLTIIDPNSGLPVGHTRLNYLESDGNQRIDTGFKPNQNTRVVCDFDISATPTDKACAVFGTRNSRTAGMYACYWGRSEGCMLDFYGSTKAELTDYPDPTALVVDKNKTVTSYNGAVVYTHTAKTFQCTSNMLLFAANLGSSVDTQCGKVRIYSCQIYDNGTLIRDYVPCLNPNGEAGMYDTVNNEFYGNAGTGNFSYGHAFVPYIESHGEEFIDTLYVVDENDTIEVDYTITNRSQHGDKMLFGSWKLEAGKRLWCETYSSDNRNNRWYVCFGSSKSFSEDSTVDQLSGNVKLSKGSFIVNGKQFLTPDFSSSAMPTTTLVLFARPGEEDPMCAWCQISNVKITRGDEVIKHYLPCRTPDGEYGMWDKVNKTFYGNSGTGAFTGA